MDSSQLYVFSVSLSALVSRSNYIGFGDKKRELCRSLAIGFGFASSDGDNIFTNKIEGIDFSEVVGFNDSSDYKTYEDEIKETINSNTPSLESSQKNLLAAIVNSIIFGFSLNQSLPLESVYAIIGNSLIEASERLFSNRPYLLDEEDIVIHPFTETVIRTLSENNDYSLVTSQIATSPKTKKVDLVHYNYYDTSLVFSNPDLDIMKSSENQYYYLSGQLNYPEISEEINFCQESGAQILTETGTVTVNILLNQPCIDRNTYIGPVNNTKFYREFNDGPYSSGNFTSDIKNMFLGFDKEKLTKSEYSSNAAILYNFTLDSSGNVVPLTAAHVLYDINGEYNLTREYRDAPMDTGCLAKYQVMRVGDARTRSQCIEYDINGNCINCVETGTTGFKFALLELNTGYSGEYAYIRTNPFVSGERLLKRGLNFNQIPYKGTTSGGNINTYQLDQSGNPIWYVGPPQISGDDTLPFFAFTNNFENIVAGQTAKVVLYPAFGKANNFKGSDSDRSFTISTKPIVTGEDSNNYSVEEIYEEGIFPKATFYTKITPYSSGDDDIKLKLFGMGNAFSGTLSFETQNQENAGYFYTGYSSSNGESLELLTANSLNYTIGSFVTGVRYIDGYTGVESAPISRLYAHDGSGNNFQYYFFDNRLLPAGTEVTNTGNWTTFAPLPSGLENNASYSRTYTTQKNENNFPRYYKGPYSKSDKKFLYPNANAISKSLNSKINGFPETFRYKIEVREETVKEFFEKYTIQNGTVYGPELINVIRPNPEGIDYGISSNIFDCSDTGCNFNDRGLGGFFYNSNVTGVRESWAIGAGAETTAITALGATTSHNIYLPAGGYDSAVIYPTPFSNYFFDDGILWNSIFPHYFLFKDQASPIDNGLYTIEAYVFVDSFSLPRPAYRFNRADVSLNGAIVYITSGNQNANTYWAQTTPNPVIGVDPIVFVEIEAGNTFPSLPISENSNGLNITVPNKHVTEDLYKENANFKQGILTETVNFDFYSGDAGLIPTINYSNRNLFHGYTGYEITGLLRYTRPAFNLSKGQLDKTTAIQSLALSSGGCYSYFFDSDPSDNPSLSVGVANLRTKNLNGEVFYSLSGQDPFYQEYLGGRSGIGAENEGGYHSKGLIGDSWLGMNYRDFGYYCTVNGDGECQDLNRTGTWGPDATVNSNRVPENDDHWFMVDVRPSGTKIYTRALDYNPMSFDYPNRPYDINSIPPIVCTDGAEDIFPLQFTERYSAFYIDLGAYLPIKTSTGNGELYHPPSGFYLGEFDRDVEIFSIEPFSGYSKVYVNNILVCDILEGVGGSLCSPPKIISGESNSATFSVSEGSVTKTLQNIKNIAYVPSGEKCYIDIKNDGLDGASLGFPESSFLYVRARKTLNNNIIVNNGIASAGDIRTLLNISGSDFWLHNHNMTNNGMERVYEIPENLENLENTVHNFLSFSRSGKMYPLPTKDFANYITKNADGTEALTINGIEEYWQIKSSSQADPIYFSGWREGSRISFRFVELEPQYGQMPYEAHSIVIPSGNCILSGEMGYLSQADNSIFSEGFYLKDATIDDGIRDNIYGPEYVSDVLTRIPFFGYPSGTFINPVLSAPSIMKQRKDRFNINRETISYSGINNLPPYNYNKLLWPALSDLRTLNPDETIEAIPPDDGTTYTNSTMLISAAQGQKLPNGKFNPDTRKVYQVAAQYQTYDSIATDALINSGTFLTSKFGFKTELKQPEEGVLVPKGSTLTDVRLGLV